MKIWEFGDPSFESDELNKNLNILPWSGHRKFAYDLTGFLQPDLIVELGTHYGCSLFSFAQAVKDSNLPSKIIAIDTWKGDEHAGFYGEEVFNLVNQTKENKFSHLNIILNRKTFIEALTDIEDASIDIIHIDGLHTYEAVSTDFNTWLPKLKENGIILFHDIGPLKDNGEENTYGSRRFWEEIITQHPYYYQFNHSWGLGVLFPKGAKNYELLQDNNFEDKIKIYQYKAEKERSQIDFDYVSDMANERLDIINIQTSLIQQKDSYIAEIESKLEGVRKLGANNSVRNNIYTQRSENRFWWYRISDCNFVPPIYSFLTDEEWMIIENWYEDTNNKSMIGEAAPPLMSLIQGFIMGNGVSNIVQLGHYVGYSSLLTAFMLKKMNKKHSMVSFDIDSFCCEYTQEWINKAGLHEYIKLELGDSADANNVKKVREYFGEDPQLVIIDSSHQYEHTLRELNLWFSVLKPGGLMILHDSSVFATTFDPTQQGGVKKAVNDWWLQNPSAQVININGSNVATPPEELIYKDGCGVTIIHKNLVSHQNPNILETSLANIKAMESSKFWKLRKLWMKLKQTIGITNEN